ncbi:MAG: MerC domain-containing protein [Acidobacteriota bacterium]|nr:MerC domain-containing protein [Acidobacteriota bacterium]
MNHSKYIPMSGNRLDIFGASLSMMCLVHCAVLPFLPLLLAGLPWLADEKMHLLLLVLITPVALYSFLRGQLRHGQISVVVLGGAGLLMLLMGPFAGETLEKPLTVVGSIVLCGAHLQNRRQLLRG